MQNKLQLHIKELCFFNEKCMVFFFTEYVDFYLFTFLGFVFIKPMLASTLNSGCTVVSL